MILIYCEHEQANLALPERKAGGVYTPPTHYHVENHFVQIGVHVSAEIAAHDAQEICKIAGYRLATSQEQDAFMRARRKSETLIESSPVREGHPHQESVIHPESSGMKKGRK